MSQSEVLEIGDILQLLPHRYPFLMVDRVLEIDYENRKIVAQKNVSVNEPFFQGHFPNHPIMPGVLLVECLAQAGSILAHKLLVHDYPDDAAMHKRVGILMGLNDVKFRRSVHPGDVLRIEVEITNLSKRRGRANGTLFVDGEKAIQAVVSFVLVDPDSILPS